MGSQAPAHYLLLTPMEMSAWGTKKVPLVGFLLEGRLLKLRRGIRRERGEVTKVVKGTACP